MANEKRQIDANELKKNYTYLWDEALGTCECVLVEDIEAAPTVDAVEVVHSYWDYKRSDAICHHCGFKWFDGCQECGIWPSEVNYCPNCGAKMDGDGNG